MLRFWVPFFAACQKRMTTAHSEVYTLDVQPRLNQRTDCTTPRFTSRQLCEPILL